ncbi:MAG: tyrosine-type recombinase/integrase [Planctomycetes bacterium]|nr:tyrosine-type recombinase/integrase [Planctomycetota bacterium]
MFVLYAIRSTLSAIRDDTRKINRKIFYQKGVFLMASEDQIIPNRRNAPNSTATPSKPPILPKLSTNYDLIMQNEPNLPKDQMNVNNVLTNAYEEKTLGEHGKNEPKTNPNEPNFKGKVVNQEKYTFNSQQIKKMFSAADVKIWTMIWLDLNCGFGCTDCGKLQWKDLDFENNRVKLARNKAEVARNLPLWPDVVEVLKKVPKSEKLVIYKSNGHPRIRTLGKTVFNKDIVKDTVCMFRHSFRHGPPCQWQKDGKDRPLIYFAFDLNSAIVHRHDFFNNSKPQARALNLLAWSWYAVKPLKYPRKGLLRYSHTGIINTYD